MRSFKGELGSGKFELTGGVTFPEKISDPVFNLHLDCKEVLVKRDDSITVRISTDLGVTGPMAAGTQPKVLPTALIDGAAASL